MSTTWNHKKVNMTLNGMAITDVIGDITVTDDAENWEFQEGMNGTVQRSLMNNGLASVTIPFKAKSDQLNVVAAMDIADRYSNAGPYVFTFVETDAQYKLFGQATIMSIAHPTLSKSGQVRNVTLKVEKTACFPGA
ncbi:MAG: hypothetical protein HUK20_10290 [Fibrobacter sp.]|nr:hypothetical protein [Fibrobacter sp.]